MTKQYDIYLLDIPKVSLNKWYAGGHWSKRKELKDQYIWMVKSQLGNLSQFKALSSYHCVYHFTFKNKPLDTTNCAAMVKIVEDILFENDKPEIIPFVGMHSIQDKKQKEAVNLWIEIYEL